MTSVYLLILLVLVFGSSQTSAGRICGLNFNKTATDDELEVSNSSNEGQGRVFMGDAAATDQFPWMVRMERFVQLGPTTWGYEPCCGGSIISRTLVLTAHHCIDNFLMTNHIRLVGGCNSGHNESNCQIRAINWTDCHFPPIGPGLDRNDIMIINLVNDPWIFTNRKGAACGPICIPPFGLEFQGMATIAGWGRTGWDPGQRSAMDLQFAEINILPHRWCDLHHHREGTEVFERGYRHYNSIKEICAGYVTGRKTSCFGDSGGPLMIRRGKRVYAIGVVAYGPDHCGQEGEGTVYTKVSYFRLWLNNHNFIEPTS